MHGITPVVSEKGVFLKFQGILNETGYRGRRVNKHGQSQLASASVIGRSHVFQCHDRDSLGTSTSCSPNRPICTRRVMTKWGFIDTLLGFGKFLKTFTSGGSLAYFSNFHYES